jgi:hypothetical protein
VTKIGTSRLTLPGPMLRRDFWLYVWRVVGDGHTELLYVGRTGDNSSPNASPHIRMGQHLGSIQNQNALRSHLIKRGVKPEECQAFDLVAHGPIYNEILKSDNFDHTDKVARLALMKLHTPLRDIVGAMEKRLAAELSAAGYTVMNTVKWQHAVEDARWLTIRKAFSEDFPKLRAIT